MNILTADSWQEYQLLDAGDGERLECWGEYVMRRPDPQVIWPADANLQTWQHPDGHYFRSKSGGGHWEFAKPLPTYWKLRWRELTFKIRPTSFKHLGLFPEQAVNWDWLMEIIRKSGRAPRVLNLFAYTGGATVAAAAAGAEVSHVDAAKGMVQWASENMELSGLKSKPVRWLVDDVLKFVRREVKREQHYDGIIMDPPSYGRGNKGETWKLEEQFYALVEACAPLLSEQPLFVLINSYATGLSPHVLRNIAWLAMPRTRKSQCWSGELGLPVASRGLTLPCGASLRCQF